MNRNFTVTYYVSFPDTVKTQIIFAAQLAAMTEALKHGVMIEQGKIAVSIVEESNEQLTHDFVCAPGHYLNHQEAEKSLQALHPNRKINILWVTDTTPPEVSEASCASFVIPEASCPECNRTNFHAETCSHNPLYRKP
jgi:hypothetical protein